MKNGRFGAALALACFLSGGRFSHAQTQATAAPAGAAVRIEARLLEQARGQEAGWGATGQILLPLSPSDPALQRWREAREVATSPSRQSVTLAPGGRGLVRVGREIPFAGWFLRHGTSCGWLEAGTEWREVESALEVEMGPPAADGSVRLAFTPEFSYLAGRSRRTVSFIGERVEVLLTPGVEARFEPGAALWAFYSRLLAGYDPLRRVWPVDLFLRANHPEAAEP
jgi:hypothetical protein